jgi:hypothetical protein
VEFFLDRVSRNIYLGLVLNCLPPVL